MTDVERVWLHYTGQRKPDGRLYHTRPRLNQKIRALINRQLKAYTVEDLCDAITQLHREDWNTGLVNGRKYLDMRLAIDDDRINERLTKFEDEQEKQQAAKEVDEQQKAVAAAHRREMEEAKRYHEKRRAAGKSSKQQMREAKN